MHTPCKDKTPYTTKKKAIKAKDRFLATARGGLSAVIRKQHPYVCRECGSWHLTTREKGTGETLAHLPDVRYLDVWRVHDPTGRQYQARVVAIEGTDVFVQSLLDGSHDIYSIDKFKGTSDGFLLWERPSLRRTPR